MISALQLPAHRPLERQTHVAPLGVRFFDPVDGSLQIQGLTVAAGRVVAEANRSGVYVFHQLPDGSRFDIQVDDPLGRFVSMRFEADAQTRGLLRLTCLPTGSPPTSAADVVPLFSSAERPLRAGMAVVRAEVWDPLAEQPAAWAVIEVSIGASQPPLRGVADQGGRVAVFFAYPEPSVSGVSPPSTLPMSEQSWQLSIAARYTTRASNASPPDVCEMLRQPLAVVWANAARTARLDQAQLRFARELVLRTHDGATPLSNLWITAAGSPP